jgi:L-amino acid N-acyltransferase YncA
MPDGRVPEPGGWNRIQLQVHDLAAENAASLHLHAKAGFRTVGTRRRVGRHHDRWRDVILIERRSTTAGSA